MTVYDSMTPYVEATENEVKLTTKPLLQIATAETVPVKAQEAGWDWSHWDGPGWHNQPWPESDIKNARGMSSVVFGPMSLSFPFILAPARVVVA